MIGLVTACIRTEGKTAEVIEAMGGKEEDINEVKETRG